MLTALFHSNTDLLQNVTEIKINLQFSIDTSISRRNITSNTFNTF